MQVGGTGLGSHVVAYRSHGSMVGRETQVAVGSQYPRHCRLHWHVERDSVGQLQ